MKNEHILLSHGSGGRMMDELIRTVFIKHFGKYAGNGNADAAILNGSAQKLAFTTDSYVVDPLFFPGANIGKLAVCGTVNDLAVSGAKPLYLSCSFIIEEGFSLKDLEAIVATMAEEAEKAGVSIVTGDTKVVNRGKADKLFINTSGIGVIRQGQEEIASGAMIREGDLLLVNGTLGDHGVAVMSAREGLSFSSSVESDCAALNHLIALLLNEGIRIRFMRDATRGGLASVLCEIAELSGLGIEIDEDALPVSDAVRGACEIFGFDPLYVANEGKVLFVVDAADATTALKLMQTQAEGRNASLIGRMSTEHPSRVVLQTSIGGRRIIDKLAGEQLPRIC
jgi:hydrogenase expression/formation protein HypE